MLLIVICVAVALQLGNPAGRVTSYDYSKFVQMVKSGDVSTVTINGNKADGETKNKEKFTVVLPDPQAQTELQRTLQERIASDPTFVVKNERDSSPAIWSILGSVIPLVLVVVAFFFIMQQTQGSGNRVMQFGKSRARLHTDDRKKVTFEDVAGIDEVKEELVEIVDFLKHPKRYLELGAKIPKGVLLFGPPGTGKTLLAKAVAGEAGVPFFTISGSDFVEMFVGVGASRVRDLFEQAKKNAPCIVFIDEIDAVGRQRGAGYGGGHDEREQTLNQLLVEMDGFNGNEGIIIMAATNRPDVLDPALLRPGRFDRQVVIDRPDLRGRLAIFNVHSKGKPLDTDIDLEVMAKKTPGFTGADIQNLMNESALLAARRRKKKVSQAEMEDAVDRIISGGPEKRSRLMSEEERRITAWHEAGHAIVGHLTPHTDPLHKVTIIPRGRALGYAQFLPAEDRYHTSKSELLDRMATGMGGRAAEELAFGEITGGAQSDIEHCTQLARRMVTQWGMSDKLGPISFGQNNNEEVFMGRDFARQRNYSEDVAAQIDNEVSSFVHGAHERAVQLLTGHHEALDKLARILLEKETLDGKELETVMNELLPARIEVKRAVPVQINIQPAF
jgi:cell division protease FtsH